MISKELELERENSRRHDDLSHDIGCQNATPSPLVPSNHGVELPVYKAATKQLKTSVMSP